MMKTLARFLSLTLSLLVLFSAVSCNESYKDAYIYYELNTIPQTLDPQLVKTDDEATVVRCLYDTLLRYNGEGELVPSAAESYTQDGLTYTFKLKEDAAWTDEDKTPVTAYDFQFAFRRAVDPKTAAPYAYTLSAIKNATDIIEGKADKSSLGVTAVDAHTLKIELSRTDNEFFNTLTTPITMPCNEDFFNKSKATYGLSAESTFCNGSYYVRIWDVGEAFLIRLAKNLEFEGAFEANSMRVYFTSVGGNNAERIAEETSDLGFITADEYSTAVSEELKFINIENQCYMLTVGENIDENLRKALLMSVNSDSIKNNLTEGYRIADSIYPASLKLKGISSAEGKISYDITAASALFNELSKSDKTNGLVLKYVNDPVCELAAKAIAAHWQQYLSSFINIEAVNSADASEIYKNGNSVLIMPFSVSGGSYKSFVSALGSNNEDPAAAQDEILSEYKHLPLFFSSSYVAFNEYMIINENLISNGIPDMALVIKSE